MAKGDPGDTSDQSPDVVGDPGDTSDQSPDVVVVQPAAAPNVSPPGPSIPSTESVPGGKFKRGEVFVNAWGQQLGDDGEVLPGQEHLKAQA